MERERAISVIANRVWNDLPIPQGVDCVKSDLQSGKRLYTANDILKFMEVAYDLAKIDIKFEKEKT
jgi:hypothetical protein